MLLNQAKLCLLRKLNSGLLQVLKTTRITPFTTLQCIMLALQVLFNDLITGLKEQVASHPSSCHSTLAQLSLPMFPLPHSELLTVSGCLLTAMKRGLMEFARAERKTGSSCRMRTQRLLVWPTIASMQDMQRQLTNRCRCSKTNYLSARTATLLAPPPNRLLLQHIQRIPAPLHARNVHVVARVSAAGNVGAGAGVACSFTGTDQDRPQ